MFSFKRIQSLFVFLFAASFALLANAANYTDISKAPAGKYTLDKTHGYVTFSYLHQGYSKPWLRFRNIDAEIDLVAEDIAKSQLEVKIEAASIDSGVDIFDDHLKGKKMFDVEKFPEITFVATKISKDKDGYTILGDLTMKGITKPVELDTVFNQGGLHFKTKRPVLGFSATTSLKRSDWNLGYAVPMVGDEVDIVIEVEFNQ